MRKSLFLLLGLIHTLLLSAQPDSSNVPANQIPILSDVTTKLCGFNYIHIRSHVGFLIAHRENMQHIPQNHVYGLELNFEGTLNGSKKWHHLYKNSKWGIGLFGANVGNTEILGNGYALFGYLKANLIKNPKRIFPRLKIGTGLGYVTKPFDADLNHKNNAIGSKLNLFVNTQFDINYYFNRWQIAVGFAFSHFSNASFRLPNLGINVPALNLSIGYGISCIEIQNSLDTIPTNKKWYFESLFTTGVKEIQTAKHRLYPSFDLLFRANKPFAKKSGIGFGFDLIYSSSLRDRMRLLSYENAETASIFQFGINLSYYQYFNNLTLFITKGFYAYTNFTDDGLLYHRFGANYTFKKKWMLYLALKSHWAKADHFELGFGYRFK